MTTRSELGESLQLSLMPSLLAAHGVDVEYDPGTGTFSTITAAPLARPVRSRPGSEAIPEYDVAILVSEDDVAEPMPNRDKVKIPGSWVDSADSTVTRRVAAVLGERAHGGAWLLGIAGGR